MMIIREIDIENAVTINRCPTRCFCTVPTTSYDILEREHLCLKCWLDFCKRNNIVIDYSNGGNQ